MGFSLSFTDVVGEPQILKTVDMESSQLDGNGENSEANLYHIKINVSNTGYSYYCAKDEDLGPKYQSISEDSLSIASFSLKVSRTNLLNQVLPDSLRLSKAERIVKEIVDGRTHSKEASLTNLPCFDINFETIFKVLGLDSEPTGTLITENFGRIKKFFGLRDEVSSIEMLTNQSMHPLHMLFQDIEANEELLDPEENTVLDKTERISNKHNVNFFEIKELPEYSVLYQESRVLSEGLLAHVR